MQTRGEPAKQYVSIAVLLKWFCADAGHRSHAIFHSLCCWLSWVIEQGPWWSRMSRDAFNDAPVPTATRRARRIDPALRDAIAAMGSQGKIARSGPQSVRILERVRKWKVKLIGDRTGDCAINQRQARYWQAGQDLFSGANVLTVSLALDATRMAGKDTLYLAMYSPDLDKSMWCPPQVPTFCCLPRKGVHVFIWMCVAVSCRFLPLLAVSCRFCFSNKQTSET